mgnify:CR=1 FL=1
MIYCNYPGIISAGMVELADTMDLGSITLVVCGFESRRPHQALLDIPAAFMLLIYAGMMKLVNMLDLGSSAARLVGSSPTTRTN